MKKVLISLLVVLGLLATTAVVTGALTTDHGTSYYGSDYLGNWANQYGYGYSDGSGIGGTGGSGYVGPGAGVQTNPKYDYSYADASCVGKYQDLDGTYRTTVHTMTGNRAALWTDDLCYQRVFDATRNIVPSTKDFGTDPLAWARSEAGPWHEIAYDRPTTAVGVLKGLPATYGKASEYHFPGIDILRIDVVGSFVDVCGTIYNAFAPWHLPGNWVIQVFKWGTSNDLCNRTISGIPQIPVAPVVPSSTTTTTTTLPQPPVTTTTRPVTTTTQPRVTTTTTTRPVVTTTTSTTAPPTTSIPEPTDPHDAFRCMLDEVEPGTSTYWRHPLYGYNSSNTMTKAQCLALVKEVAMRSYSNDGKDIRWVTLTCSVCPQGTPPPPAAEVERGWTRLNKEYQY